jgi:diketogulonate reductase-like aldo/keto reductase
MNDKKHTIIFNNGVELPFPPIALGTGTIHYTSKYTLYINQKCKNGSLLFKIIRKATFWIVKMPQRIEVIRSVYWALKAGYRIIDTSSAYKNLNLIRAGIKLSGVKREDIFITSRVSNSQQFSSKPIESFVKKDLKSLGTDYLDLYMFHWPVTEHYINTWLQMEEIYKKGYVRNIGVANCHIHHLNEIFRNGTVIPAINQFEIHPFLSQKELIHFCLNHDIQVEAYTPLGRKNAELLNNSDLQSIATKYSKTIPQIILRWDVQNGIIPTPKSRSKERLKQNIDVFNFELTQEEISMIDGLNRNLRFRYDPDNCDFSIL